MGETGGKNFHFVEKTADLDLVVEKTYEGAFGYSGQKCSACSRLYLPMEMWEPFKHKMLQKIKLIPSKDCGVISHYKYNELVEYINELKNDEMVDVYSPLKSNDETSYFICPTMVLCHTSNHFIMEKEMFGPILAVRLYTDIDEAIKECQMATPYRLTGAVFSQDDAFLDESINTFAENCGNFYINDKSTGAVVGQQPFGGFGVSGTNDKAGDKSFMRRLCNQRNIKVSNKKKL
jgi:1-pyrroline-5-carboxylate dehydrogenase